MELNIDRLSTDELLRVAFDATADVAVPVDLWERVQSTTLGTGDQPHPGWGDTDGGPLSALSAFITTAAELGDLLETLAPDDWTRSTPVEGVTVRALVEHLVSVERYVLGQLDRRPPLEAPRREDHWSLATMLAADMSDEAGSVVAATWWSELLGVVAASGELGPDREVRYHHLVGSLRGLLVVRTFELWTHGDDIRQATGRPLSLLDEDRLSLMVNQLMRVLPLGLALSDTSQPGCTARINLTGPGGGRFDVPLAFGEVSGEPDITITAAVIDFCRLAAGRLTPDELDVLIEGDRGLLTPILAGATAFAAD
jgi:uncharacterized protein (TIGR03083 family)